MPLVFRPPFHNKLFAAVIGSGIQIFAMLAITIFFAMLGMLSPASRGALLTAAIFLYDDDDDDSDDDDDDDDSGTSSWAWWLATTPADSTGP